MKVKVMGSNSGCLLKSFLLYKEMPPSNRKVFHANPNEDNYSVDN